MPRESAPEPEPTEPEVTDEHRQAASDMLNVQDPSGRDSGSVEDVITQRGGG